MDIRNQIETGIVTDEILFTCLCATEVVIGKYAVLAEKWEGCGNSIQYVYACNRDYFVRVSNKIWCVLLLKFSEAEIDARLLVFENATDNVPEKLLRMVYRLLLNGNYVTE